jgi:hypothetical protein
MLSVPAPGTRPGPKPRLLVSLAAWTWPGSGPDGQEIAHILITHSPSAVVHATPEVVEARMRRLAGGFAKLGTARDIVPDAGRCLQVTDDQVLLHVPGAPGPMRLPTRPDWTALVARNREAALLLGLDMLPQSAGAAEIDAYLDAAIQSDRLLFGRVRTADPATAPGGNDEL